MSTPDAKASDSGKLLLAALAIVIPTLAVYSQTRSFQFVLYDDPKTVASNPLMSRGLTLESVAKAFSFEQEFWLPVTTLSHLLDYQLYGGHAGGHHLTSVVLHVLNALLLLTLLWRMTRLVWPGAAVAALLALHPLHVESVAWVAERKDVLSMFFALLCLHAYTSYARSGRPLAYVWTAVFLALGLLSKPMVVTLPAVMLLLDLWPLRRWPAWGAARLLVEKAPLLAMSLASTVVAFLNQSAAGAMSDTLVLPWAARITNALVAYAWYLLKMFWPTGLGVLYPHPEQVPAQPWTTGTVAASAALLLLITGLALWQWRRPYLLVGWLWFLGTLLPVIGLIQIGVQAFADRYTYLPLVGPFIMIAFGAAEVAQRRPRWRPGIAVAALAIMSALSAKTFVQVSYWHDSVALFEHTLRVSRANPTVHTFLGMVHHERERYEEAERQYLLALELNPNHVDALVSLGQLRKVTGQPEEAERLYRRAIALRPEAQAGHYHLANLLGETGRIREAAAAYRRAADLGPVPADGWYNWATVLLLDGQPAQAAALLEDVLVLWPDHAGAHQNLALALLQLDAPAQALTHTQRAAELTGGNRPAILLLLSLAQEAVGDVEQARAAAERALELAGEDAALADQARARLRQLDKLQPQEPEP